MELSRIARFVKLIISSLKDGRIDENEAHDLVDSLLDLYYAVKAK